jgi:hypothetical protein
VGKVPGLQTLDRSAMLLLIEVLIYFRMSFILSWLSEVHLSLSRPALHDLKCELNVSVSFAATVEMLLEKQAQCI